MKYLQILFAACFGAIPLLNPDAALAKKRYKGADAGYLVYSNSALRSPIYFDLLYRRIPADAEPRWKGSMECTCQGTFVGTYPGKMDYKGYESGNVTVEQLPPGQ